MSWHAFEPVKKVVPIQAIIEEKYKNKSIEHQNYNGSASEVAKCKMTCPNYSQFRSPDRQSRQSSDLQPLFTSEHIMSIHGDDKTFIVGECEGQVLQKENIRGGDTECAPDTHINRTGSCFNSPVPNTCIVTPTPLRKDGIETEERSKPFEDPLPQNGLVSFSVIIQDTVNQGEKSSVEEGIKSTDLSSTNRCNGGDLIDICNHKTVTTSNLAPDCKITTPRPNSQNKSKYFADVPLLEDRRIFSEEEDIISDPCIMKTEFRLDRFDNTRRSMSSPHPGGTPQTYTTKGMFSERTQHTTSHNHPLRKSTLNDKYQPSLTPMNAFLSSRSLLKAPPIAVVKRLMKERSYLPSVNTGVASRAMSTPPYGSLGATAIKYTLTNSDRCKRFSSVGPQNYGRNIQQPSNIPPPMTVPASMSSCSHNGAGKKWSVEGSRECSMDTTLRNQPNRDERSGIRTLSRQSKEDRNSKKDRLPCNGPMNCLPRASFEKNATRKSQFQRNSQHNNIVRLRSNSPVVSPSMGYSASSNFDPNSNDGKALILVRNFRLQNLVKWEKKVDEIEDRCRRYFYIEDADAKFMENVLCRNIAFMKNLEAIISDASEREADVECAVVNYSYDTFNASTVLNERISKILKYKSKKRSEKQNVKNQNTMNPSSEKSCLRTDGFVRWESRVVSKEEAVAYYAKRILEGKGINDDDVDIRHSRSSTVLSNFHGVEDASNRSPSIIASRRVSDSVGCCASSLRQTQGDPPNESTIIDSIERTVMEKNSSLRSYTSPRSCSIELEGSNEQQGRHSIASSRLMNEGNPSSTPDSLNITQILMSRNPNRQHVRRSFSVNINEHRQSKHNKLLIPPYSPDQTSHSVVYPTCSSNELGAQKVIPKIGINLDDGSPKMVITADKMKRSKGRDLSVRPSSKGLSLEGNKMTNILFKQVDEVTKSTENALANYIDISEERRQAALFSPPVDIFNDATNKSHTVGVSVSERRSLSTATDNAVKGFERRGRSRQRTLTPPAPVSPKMPWGQIFSNSNSKILGTIKHSHRQNSNIHVPREQVTPGRLREYTPRHRGDYTSSSRGMNVPAVGDPASGRDVLMVSPRLSRNRDTFQARRPTSAVVRVPTSSQRATVIVYDANHCEPSTLSNMQQGSISTMRTVSDRLRSATEPGFDSPSSGKMDLIQSPTNFDISPRNNTDTAPGLYRTESRGSSNDSIPHNRSINDNQDPNNKNKSRREIYNNIQKLTAERKEKGWSSDECVELARKWFIELYGGTQGEKKLKVWLK